MRRKNPRRIRDLTHGPVVREIVGFGLFWLGIGHLPIILELCTGELVDVSVSVGAVIYLLRTRRTCTRSLQTAHKPNLVRISPVM